MKQCSYCGKEYSDDTIVCPIDEQPIVASRGSVAFADDCTLQSEPIRSEVEHKPVLLYPEYQWSAKDAWKFLGMTVIFELLWFLMIAALPANFHRFYLSGPGFFVRHLMWGLILVVTAAYFMRVNSFRGFCQAIGLDRRPTSYAWFGVASALIIRFAGHIALALHWAKGYTNWDIYDFLHTRGFGGYFFLGPLLFTAFLEEPVNRGFLFTGFRRSYALVPSMTLVVGYTAFTHWNQYRHLGLAVITLSALTVVQCHLREKSPSLWDIIICHVVFNASSLFLVGIW